MSRVFRHGVHLVYEITLSAPLPAVQWDVGEQLWQFGPDDLDHHLTSDLYMFLGGESAFESLLGVRNGDRLFVIAKDGQFVYRGYVLFNTRQKKLIGEHKHTPLIGNCFTAPSARGHGIYRRALTSALSYLQSQGYRRVIIETDPENYASIKGIEATGFCLTRKVHAWIFLNLFVVHCISAGACARWRAFYWSGR